MDEREKEGPYRELLGDGPEMEDPLRTIKGIRNGIAIGGALWLLLFFTPVEFWYGVIACLVIVLYLRS